MAGETDLDWLADDEGNLRPAAARVLEGHVPPADGAVAGRIAPPLGGCALAVLLGVAAAALLASGIHCPESERPRVRPVEPSAVPMPAPGRIVGGDVHLRAGPGRAHPVLAKLTDGTPVEIVGYHEGWCEVGTGSYGPGWVFGAYVRDSRGPWRGAGVVVRLVERAGPSGPRLRPGEKVLVETEAGDRAVLLFPNGERIEVPKDALVYLD